MQLTRIVVWWCSQYQVRLHDVDSSGGLIYAPRDDDRYITRASSTPEGRIQIDRRVSQERRLIRRLEDSLSSCLDDRKQALYEKVRIQHKVVMDHIVADLSRGLARCALS